MGICNTYKKNYAIKTTITNFIGHDLAVIIMRNLLFIGSYGIDMDVIINMGVNSIFRIEQKIS